jgi:nicotinate-nucleotide pyrophosphorylase (carboxylating)
MEPGQEVLVVEGRAATLLAGERTALNFLQRLSGIATTSRAFVRRIEGTGAVILDTRKTTPGWRSLEKYAVSLGGGRNHRTGLYDQALFKENHLALARAAREPLGEIVRRAREATGAPVEVEVRDLEELRAALEAGAELLLLDNMSLEEMREAVELVRGLPDSDRPLLEASGGITLETVRAVAETGVDRISVGALTHSPRALDLAMYIE